MKAKDILETVRYRLADTRKDRWTDKRLLALLSNGLKDIAKNTTLFVETVFVILQDNVVDIDLTDRAVKIIRVEYLDQVLPFITFDEMDKKDPEWQLAEGDEIEYIVYDKQARGCVKIYPIVTNQINDNIVYNSNYGVVTSISYGDIQPYMSNVYGDISGIPDTGILKVYYIRKHDTITDIEQELEIDELCEDPLNHYIVGHALRDNQDTQNRAIGNEELNLYKSLVEEFSIEKAYNFVRNKRETPYNPIG